MAMKCKKIIPILLCFMLTPLFALNVCAAENDELQALRETLIKTSRNHSRYWMQSNRIVLRMLLET